MLTINRIQETDFFYLEAVFFAGKKSEQKLFAFSTTELLEQLKSIYNIDYTKHLFYPLNLN